MTYEKTIYDFKEYKAFLLYQCQEKPGSRGLKSALAAAMNCQATYLSQVLKAQAHLSLEQAQSANDFFNHSSEESHYFLLLVQKSRAGTVALRKYFELQIQEIHKKRLTLSERLQKKTSLNSEDQSIYYSSWVYAAVHLAVAIPQLDSKEKIARYLGISMKRLLDALEFLINIGLIQSEGGRYRVGTSKVFIGNNSVNIIKHHMNWRNQALESLDRETEEEFHYSSVFTLSKEDMLKIKVDCMELTKRNSDIIGPSPEEELCCFTLDLFRLQKNRL